MDFGWILTHENDSWLNQTANPKRQVPKKPQIGNESKRTGCILGFFGGSVLAFVIFSVHLNALLKRQE
jgi:hypothetical protein